jgi:ABC-type sugar transport system ATPase subunit
MADPSSRGLPADRLAGAHLDVPEVPEPELSLIGVTRGRALREFELHVAAGELVALVGPSGAGKSTALRIAAGIDAPGTGQVRFAGVDVTRATPAQRDVACVLQGSALHPHLSVYENLAFGLRLRDVDDDTLDARVGAVARSLGLAALLGRGTRALSGGERQRVALGRALVCRPRVFVLDEPLAGLDGRTRLALRHAVRRAHDASGAATLYATHDTREAAALAERVVVLRDGAIAREIRRDQRGVGLRTQSSTCL